MSKDGAQASKRYGSGTRVVAAGRNPMDHHGFVNPPVYHGSTVLFPDVATMKTGQKYNYGRRGSPTMDSLEQALTELEGGRGTKLVGSGLAAISLTFMSFVRANGHVLIPDNVYQPSRHFCETVLKRLGITTTYYDPLIGAAIADLIQDNTQLLFIESPGSQTFEMPDIKAIVEAAKAHGVTTAMDNTWATPLFLRPLDHGIDVAVYAGTKYLVGHSDAMMGTVTANADAWRAIHDTWGACGLACGPDDIYLAQRGLRTMDVRLQRHMESALKVARWLEGRSEVSRVLHPGLESDPGHAMWKRDFSGSSGLFSLILKPGPQEAVAALLDDLDLFGLGYSWGGYESLAIPFDCSNYRSVTTFAPEGPAIRLHIGLEDPDDLMADLDAGLARWREAGGGS